MTGVPDDLVYLDPEWLDVAGRLVADLGADADARSVDLSYQIPDGPQGPVRYRVTDGAEGPRLAVSAPVGGTSLTMDYATACAIARGERNAARAFLDGDVRLDGPSEALLEAAPVLARIAEALAPLRARTRYPPTQS